jgi:hypothetical protein
MTIMPMIRTLFSTAVAGVLATVALPSSAQDGLRPEVARPLQSAQDLMKAGKYKDALARVREAEGVASRTAYENFVIDRMRGSAAAAAGDEAAASSSFRAVLDSGRLPAAERLQVLEALAFSAYRGKDYARSLQWAERYFKEGGSSPQMANLQASAHYLTGDYAGVVRDMQARVQAIERSVPVVDETTLRTLAASHAKLGDDAGYLSTLEKLLVHHPKPEYWTDALDRVQRKPDFSDRLRLDLYRLRLATSTLEDADQYVEMAQLALEVGLPAEAVRVVEAGHAAGKLGTGAQVERHRRLRELAAKQAAEDDRSLAADVVGRNAESLVATGQALVAAGRVDRGIELLELGIARGGLKRPDEARLRLAQAYLSGGRKAKAVETFKLVRGSDGSGDLARLWAIHAGR